MAKLGQLYLQFTFVSAGALGEDIQDQTGTVNHTTFAQTLKVAFLSRRQGMVKDDD